MTPDELATAIRGTLTEAVDAGGLVIDVPAEVPVERPRGGHRGDWSSTIALQLAGEAGMPAGDLAARLAARLGQLGGVRAVDVAGPGFVNVALEDPPSGELVMLVGAAVDAVTADPAEGVSGAGSPDGLTGVDAGRDGWTWSSPDSPFEVHADVLHTRRFGNPVFSLQYAHARSCRLARLAACVHAWHDTCEVLPQGRDDVVTDLHRTRLWLNAMARQVLGNGLLRLGVAASERI